MSYLIDANVLCETVKPLPNSNVMAWFERVPARSLYVSVLSIGEIRKGVEKLPPGAKKEKILVWLEHTLPGWFEDHMLPIDVEVCDRWGYLMGASKQTLPAIDSLIAATALTHNLKLVTRNVDDFPVPGLEILNPWL